MIALIRGVLARRAPESVIVDVNGVGYRLLIPLTTFYRLPEEGSTVSLHVHTCVREDAFLLYGFLSTVEKELFEKLISVSKIGPKIGLNIISGLPAEELRSAIARHDVVKLSSIPGVGVKTAERLILELRDKIGSAPADEEGVRPVHPAGQEERRVLDEVLGALVNLGYKRKDAEKVLKEIWEGGERNEEALIRRTLARLAL